MESFLKEERQAIHLINKQIPALGRLEKAWFTSYGCDINAWLERQHLHVASRHTWQLQYTWFRDLPTPLRSASSLPLMWNSTNPYAGNRLPQQVCNATSSFSFKSQLEVQLSPDAFDTPKLTWLWSDSVTYYPPTPFTLVSTLLPSLCQMLDHQRHPIFRSLFSDWWLLWGMPSR